MAKNKKDQPEQDPEQKALEQRIDAMMDPKQKSSSTAKSTSQPTAAAPEIDIFKDPKTAPQVSPDLLKQIGIKPGKSDAGKDTVESPASKDTPEPPKPSQPQLVKYRPAAAISPNPAPKEPKPQPAAEPEPDQTVEPPEKPADIQNETGSASQSPAAELAPANLDDPDTDKAVDDIAVEESDELLAAEDAARGNRLPQPVKRPSSRAKGWRQLLRSKRLWLLLPVLVIVILMLPSVRYKAFGLFVKKTVSIKVLDSATATPVSNAEVTIKNQHAKTDANGNTRLHLSPGKAELTVSKQYYKTFKQDYFVGIKGDNKPQVKLVAQGRQVTIQVTNNITGKPLPGANITVLRTTAKTDSHGKAVVVLPANDKTDKIQIAATGYNLVNAKVTVTSQVTPLNSFALTPSGKVYFLSNRSGNIDVVKANLDGSDRQTVLPGTGREESRATSLLASRDWRFLVLSSRRETAQPALYLIDTRTDKLTKIDSDSANYQLVGWYGHNFVYDRVNTTMNRWQSGRETLKSYDADHDDLNQLDQNQAEGDGSSYAYQSFDNFYLLDNLVAYSTQWYTYDSTGAGHDLGSKTASIRGVSPTGQGKKDYQTFDAKGVAYIQAVLYEPQAIDYGIFNNQASKTDYYQLEDQKVSQANLDPNVFSKPYPTYLVSPAGKQTFWTELRDGKNTLFTGDNKAASKKQIASSSDYAPYGWYSDDYLLVSKSSSELYVMPATGPTTNKQPVKITDYYKPAQTLNGYGYGYGGL